MFFLENKEFTTALIIKVCKMSCLFRCQSVVIFSGKEFVTFSVLINENWQSLGVNSCRSDLNNQLVVMYSDEEAFYQGKHDPGFPVRRLIKAVYIDIGPNIGSFEKIIYCRHANNRLVEFLDPIITCSLSRLPIDIVMRDKLRHPL